MYLFTQHLPSSKERTAKKHRFSFLEELNGTLDLFFSYLCSRTTPILYHFAIDVPCSLLNQNYSMCWKGHWGGSMSF